MTPRVSAIIPTYNRLPYIGRALASVLNQTVPVDEVIVVDDGSTDGTAERLRFQFGDRIRLIVQPNQGVSRARRAGLEAATGDWIAFLDSDDEWATDRNRRFLGAAERVPADVAWLFGDTEIRTDRSQHRLFAAYGLHLSSDVDVYDDPMSTQYPIQFSLMPSSLIRRHVLMEVGAFTHGLRSSEDLLAGWQVAARYRMAAIADVVTVVHREAELAASSLDRAGKQTPDYHRARMLGFDALARSKRPGPWGLRHSEEVRRYCLRQAETQGDVRGLRSLALQQFRHSLSGRAVLFAGAMMFGMAGVRWWNHASERRQKGAGRGGAARAFLSHEEKSLAASGGAHD